MNLPLKVQFIAVRLECILVHMFNKILLKTWIFSVGGSLLKCKMKNKTKNVHTGEWGYLFFYGNSLLSCKLLRRSKHIFSYGINRETNRKL